MLPTVVCVCVVLLQVLLPSDYVEEQQTDIRKEMLQAKNNITLMVVSIVRVCYAHFNNYNQFSSGQYLIGI